MNKNNAKQGLLKRLMYPREGVLYERDGSEGRAKDEYWLTDNDLAWKGMGMFTIARTEVMQRDYNQRLALRTDIIRAHCIDDKYSYMWRMFVCMEAYIKARGKRVIGVCEKWISAPEQYGLAPWDFRRTLFKTPVCEDVKTCGETLCRMLVEYLNKMTVRVEKLFKKKGVL